MNKKIILLVPAILFFIFFGRSWFSNSPTVGTSSFARVSAQPSSVMIIATLSSSGQNPSTVLQTGKNKLAETANIVQGMGASEVKFTSEQLVSDGNSAAQSVTGIQITINDVTKVSQVADQLVNQGLNISSVRYLVVDDQRVEVQEQLFDLALAKARSDAGAIAAKSGMRLADVKSVAVENSTVEAGSVITGPFTEQLDLTSTLTEYQATYRVVFEMKPWYTLW